MAARAQTRLTLVVTGGPAAEAARLSAEELAAAAGISPVRLARLVRLGLIAPLAPDAGEFTATEAARLKRMLRLQRDLGVNLMGAAIIVDLVERLGTLEAERARPR
jgi:chaperone modulatory protein CbpM